MNFTIKDLRYFLEGSFDLIPKSLGVELVELGFLKYKKLTPENYEYWWYEVSDLSKIDKEVFTYDWCDLVQMNKMKMVKEFISYHNDHESIYKLITAILNIEAARFDGFDKNTGKLEFERQIEFYYGNRKKEDIQMMFKFS